MIPGVVLAGGLASRMGGGDKGLRLLDDRPLLAHVIARLAPQAAPLALNANGDPARFAAFGLPVLPDTAPDRPGPLAGVLAGLDWAAAQGVEEIVTVAANSPFFPPDLVARLRAAARAGGVPLAMAVTPRPGGGVDRHPTFGLWRVALRADLRRALGEGVRKVVLWTGPHGCAEAVFPDGDAFFNVNTPEDLEAARRRVAGATT